MKRLLYVAPALALSRFIPGTGVLGAVVLLVSLIFVHELGHFLVAKAIGIPVDIFSLGIGPRVVGFRWKETDVRLSLLPVGGYVHLAGYNPEEPDADDPYGFLSQPIWRRGLFYLGGILANVAMTVVLLYVLGLRQVRVTVLGTEPSPLLVLDVGKGTPAETAGLRPGDAIHRLGDLAFPSGSSSEAIAYIEARADQPIPLVLDREGKERRLVVTPKALAGRGKIGITFEPSRLVTQIRPFQASDLRTAGTYAVVRSVALAAEVGQSLAKLVTGRVKAYEVGGPITIMKAGSQAAKRGWVDFLFFTSLISMNLAILNLLPLPILDGGHLAFLVLEKLRGRDLPIKLKERILAGGMVFLAAVMGLVIFMDLFRR